MQYDASKTALFHPESQPALLGTELPWTTHAICAELARLAYWHYEEGGQVLSHFQGILKQAQFTEPALLLDTRSNVGKRSSTQGFAVSKGDTAYVAFSGTQPDDPTDILIDGLFWPVAWQGDGLVHDGFLRAYESIAGQLHAWLEQAQASRVYITGHSLGAAVATLAAALLPDSRLVTFGSPRVGNAAFAAMFKNRVVDRYVHCADIVTILPPESEYYEHLHGMHYLDRHGALIAAASGLDMLQDQTIAKAEYLFEYAWRSENVGFRSLADHAPVNYVQAVLGL
ncbi:lipase family protein [Undibacterium sp. Di27W]|uniref:lipase family protein n=1 Tax=Undibacterium sp. Di27W TaxID=3413036 RepID=UPI003BF0ECCC